MLSFTATKHNTGPSTLTSENIQAIDARAKALADCIEIIELRIRFNMSLIDFAANATDEEYLSMLRAKHPRDFTIAHVTTHRELDKTNAENDLEKLQYILDIILKLNENPDQKKESIFLAGTMNSFIHREKFDRDKVLQDFEDAITEERKKLSAAIRAKNKSAQITAKNKIAEAEASKEDVVRTLNGEYTEYSTYIKVFELLCKYVFTDVERDFCTKYTQTTIERGSDKSTIANMQFTREFITFANANIRYANKIRAEIAARHEGINPPILDVTPEAMLDADKIISDSKNNIHMLFDFYLHIAGLRETFDMSNQYDQIIVNYERSLLQLKQEEERISAANSAAMEATQKEEERQKLTQEQEETLKQQREARAQRKEELRLEKIQKEQAKEAESERKVLAKRARHQETFRASHTVVMDVDKKTLQSSFKVSEDTVRKNIDILEKLFAARTKRIRYSEVQALLAPFGGKIIRDTASSHQYIIFNKKYYQQVVFTKSEDDTEQQSSAATASSASVKKGLAKPHEPFLIHNNLELLRNAVASVMPENWMAILKEESSQTLKFSRLGV